MNKWIGIGRLTREPEIRNTEAGKAVAKYTLAVDRPKSKDGEQEADFISCTAFGKSAEFVKNYLRKGMKIAVIGAIRTGSYTNKEGVKVYTTEVVVENHEFCESKNSNSGNPAPEAPASYGGYTPSPVVPAASDFALLDDDDAQLPF